MHSEKPSILLILGDQLFPHNYVQAIHPTVVFMAEDYGLCQNIKHHKQKIVLFFSAMRTYARALQRLGIDVIYESLRESSIYEKLRGHVEQRKIRKIHYFEIDDIKVRKAFLQAFQGFDLVEHRSPKFLTTHDEFRQYLQRVRKPFMKTFYEETRVRLNILMDDKKPVGGKYSFDQENRKKLPRKTIIPTRKKITHAHSELNEIIDLVQKNFSDHTGLLGQFIWPTTREQYLYHFDDFIDHYLSGYGPYQDALSTRDPFLFHSLISPGLNLGLILPSEILSKLLPIAQEHPDKLASIEGFIRQLIGWREFVRGIYENYHEKMETHNYWGHTRLLKHCWWQGTTGMEPVDKVIQKCLHWGYAHHIERLMVMSNIFNLIEANPRDVYRWFMEMFIDSADWVMQANVFGMGLMSEGGVFATKPYICSSNYLLKMSDYKKGPWCQVLDGLYWRFIGKHRSFFINNPRMSMMVHMYDNMPEGKRTDIIRAAEEFIIHTTAEA